MIGTKDRQTFISDVVDSDLLQLSIDWIGRNLDPADVFPETKLVEWATSNGYVEEE